MFGIKPMYLANFLALRGVPLDVLEEVLAGDAAESTILRLCKTANLLGISEREIGLEYGRHFVSAGGLEVDLPELFRACAHSLPEMIQRLQELPIYFGLSDEEMEEEGPGSSHIWIDKVSPASFQVHSQSKNPYFSDWLEGLLDELTRHYFEDLRVNIKALPKEASKSNNESEGIYTVLEVCTLPGERNFSIYCQEQEALQAHAKESQWGMGAATFYELFPYHIILNNHGKVLQAGDVIRRMFPALAVSGASHISEFFTMQHPTNAEFGFDYLDTCCSGTAAVMLSSQGLLLKGNWCMKELRMRNKDGDGEETVKEVVKLFLGAPYFHNLADVKRNGLCLTDLPAHTLAADLLLEREARQADFEWLHEEYESMKEERDRAIETCERLHEQLLHSYQGKRKTGTTAHNPLFPMIDTPAAQAINLIDRFIMLSDVYKAVDVSEMLAVRNGLLLASKDLTISKGLNLGSGLFDAYTGGDAEVSQNLKNLLAPEPYPSGVEDALSNYQNEISARASGLVPIKEHVATESYLTQSLASSTLMPSTNRTGQTQASSRTGQTEEPPITKTLSASEVRSMGYARRGSNVSCPDITDLPQARHSASRSHPFPPLSSGGSASLVMGGTITSPTWGTSGGSASLLSGPPITSPAARTTPLLFCSQAVQSPASPAGLRGAHTNEGRTNDTNAQGQDSMGSLLVHHSPQADCIDVASPRSSAPRLLHSACSEGWTGPEDNDNDDGSANRSSGKTLKGMKKLMSKVRSAFKTVFNTDGEADGSRTPTSTEPEPRSPTRTIPDLAAPLINPAMSGDVPDCTYRTSRSVQSHFLNDDLEKGSASSRPLSLKKPMDIPSPVGIPRRRTEHYERIKTISFSAGGAVSIAPELSYSNPFPGWQDCGSSCSRDTPLSEAMSPIWGRTPIRRRNSGHNEMAKLSLDMTGRLKNRRSSVGVVPSHYIRTSSDVLAGLVSEGIASLGDARRTKELWPKSPHAPGSPSASIMKLAKEPSDKLSLILEHVDDWTFDIFELQRATNGRTLSVLAFNLFKRADITSRFGLDESKLARFLTRVEDGYPPHPYHCREHAADVLRTLHVIATRGGLIKQATPMQLEPGEIINSLQGAKNPGCSPSFFRSPPHAGQEGQDSRLAPTRDAMSLFFVYLAAIIHDFEHRGVNNQFLVQTGDPLALLYNDMSPMENHHISASFMLLKEERYNFMAMMPKKVWQVLRTQVIELVLATDMKQHFSLVSMFESKSSALLLQKAPVPTAAMLKVPASPKPPLVSSSHQLGKISSSRKIGMVKKEAAVRHGQAVVDGQRRRKPVKRSWTVIGELGFAQAPKSQGRELSANRGFEIDPRRLGRTLSTRGGDVSGSAAFRSLQASKVHLDPSRSSDPPSICALHEENSEGHLTQLTASIARGSASAYTSMVMPESSTSTSTLLHESSAFLALPESGPIDLGFNRTSYSSTPLNGGRPSSKASSLARQCNPLVSNNGCSNFMTRSVSNTTLTGLLAHSWQGASTNGLLTSLPTSPIPSGHLDMLESLETVEAPQERSKLVLNSIPHERHMFGALQRGPVGLPRRMNKVDSTNGSTHSRQSSTQMGMRYSHNADSSPIVMPSDLATIRSPALSTTNNLCSPAPEPPLPTHQAPMDPEFMTLVWKIALKCADLSNLANSRPVAKKWVLLLEEEMFRQGDKERAASLPVSALMDRNKAGVTKSQPGFFNVVAIPLFSSFAQCFPSASAMLEGAQDNLAMWVEAEKKAEQEKEAVKLKRVEVQAAAHLKKIADMADSMAGPG